MTTSPGTRFAGLSILAFAAGLMVVQPAAAIDIFGGQRTQQAPVLMAQAGDTSVRLSQMEDEIRRLTGKVEEMSFLVLQLQEQLRNAQADNDMRFQDLEGGSGGGGSGQSGQRSGANRPHSSCRPNRRTTTGTPTTRAEVSSTATMAPTVKPRK